MEVIFHHDNIFNVTFTLKRQNFSQNKENHMHFARSLSLSQTIYNDAIFTVDVDINKNIAVYQNINLESIFLQCRLISMAW